MLKVKPKGLLAITFLLMIGLVPLFYLVSIPFPRVFSMTEGRNLKRFTLEGLGFKSALDVFQDGDKSRAASMGLNLVLNRALPEQIEKAVSDQFPLRDQFIQLTYAFGRGLNDLVYGFSDMPAKPATLDRDRDLYILLDGSGYLYAPQIFNQSVVKHIDDRIANYQTLIKTYPYLNWYLYRVDLIENSEFNPLNDYFYDADRGQTYQYFLNNKPNSLQTESFSLTNFEDYKKYFYKTDWHWNIHGVLSAYDAIYTLLSTHYPEISEKHSFGPLITFPAVTFTGGFRRYSVYPVDAEPFEVVDYQLPPYKCYLNGDEITYGQSKDYFEGNYSTNPATSRYIDFFGPDFVSVEFVFENRSDRNILIFGDSYDNPLVPLIASHYHQTYSVDLRNNGNFSLGAFLADHDVDDVLFIGDSELSYTSLDWIINP